MLIESSVIESSSSGNKSWRSSGSCGRKVTPQLLCDGLMPICETSWNNGLSGDRPFLRFLPCWNQKKEGFYMSYILLKSESVFGKNLQIPVWKNGPTPLRRYISFAIVGYWLLDQCVLTWVYSQYQLVNQDYQNYDFPIIWPIWHRLPGLRISLFHNFIVQKSIDTRCNNGLCHDFMIYWFSGLTN